MPLDVLPDTIIVKTRDEWLALYLRSHLLRAPLASVAEDSEPWVTGSALADQLNIQSENARRIGRSIPLSSQSGSQLDQRLAELGLSPRYPQTGSQGSVDVETSLLGSTVPRLTECTDENGQIFYCTRTALYLSGQAIPLAAKSTGPSTNLAAGTKLVWSAPPGGLVSRAFVHEQTNLTGLSGGRLAETDEEVRGRISDSYANPAVAGNAAAYIAAIEFSQGHGVAVQKGFVIPAALGPGTTAFCFTMSPPLPGSSRAPNPTQIQLVRDYLIGLFPADDQILDCILLETPTRVAVQVNWSDGAIGWQDTVPWPPYYLPDTTPQAIVVDSVASPTVFTVDCLGGLRAGALPPQPGNAIAVFDPSAGKFKKKVIATVVGTGPWSLTIDQTNGASDNLFIPLVGERVCPWSDSLGDVVLPVLTYFGTMGPGEQQAVFYDPGTRQRRVPLAPRYWPSTISNRLAVDLLDINSVEDAVVVEGLNTSTTAGTAGTSLNIQTLGYLSVFPI
jgi:hypothetical protein